MAKSKRNIENSLFQDSPDAIYLSSREGYFLDANRAMLELFIYDYDEIVGMDVRKIYADAKERTTFQKNIEKTGFVKDYPISLKKKNGDCFPCLVTASVRRGSDNKVIGYQGFIRDISAQKASEELLRQEREKIRLYLDTIGVILIAIDKEMKITLINKVGCRMLGFEEDEVLDKSLFKRCIPPTLQEYAKSRFDTIAKAPNQLQEYTEIPIVSKSGEEHFIAWHSTVLFDKEGKFNGILTSGQDITSRKKAEEELRQSEAKSKALISAMPDLLFQIDKDGIFLSYKGQKEDLYRPPEEFLGKNATELLPPDIAQKTMSAVNKVMKTSEMEVFEYELPLDNRLHQYEARMVKMDRYSVLVLVRDITQQKQSDEELRKSNERFRLLAENVPGVIYLCKNDERYTMLYLNDWVESMTGYTKEDFLQDKISFVDLYHPEDAERLVAEANQAIMKKQPFHLIYRIYHRNGGLRWVDERGVAIYDQSGNVLLLEGIIIDITERKQAFESLRESENKYRALVETLQEGLVIVDENENIIFANQAFGNIIGWEREEAIGKNLRNFVLETDYPKLINGTKRRKLGFTDLYEIQIMRKDKEYREIRLSASPWNNDKGDYLGAIGVVLDITEQKKVSDALKKGEILQNAIYRISESVDTSATLDELFQAVHKIISDVMPARNFYISLYDAKNQLISFPYFIDEVDVPEPPRGLRKGLTEYVLRTGKSLLATIEKQNELLKAGETEIIGVPAPIWLGVPLMVEKRAIGVMAVQHYSDGQAYGEKEQQVLEFVSTQVAKAIERKQTEEALRVSEELTRGIVSNAPVGVAYLDAKGIILYLNPSMRRILGTSEDDDKYAIGDKPMEITNVIDAGGEKHLRKLLNGEIISGLELEYTSRLGSTKLLKVHAAPRKNLTGEIVGAVVMCEDITGLKELENQLLQAQKMEAVGRFAGGLAHDFNNMLTAIIGYCDLARLAIKSNDPLNNFINQIFKAAESASGLTRQLLAFSRKQTLEPRVIDLNSIISDMEKMLQRLLGEDIQLLTFYAPDLGKVKVDPGKIEQVIVNLSVNARDAMPKGGQLVIETCNVELDEEYIKTHAGVKIGSYVMISVSDTGSGMSKEVIKHIFDPFFTTKEIGKGTGLGLSIVYGVIKQSEGYIWVYSEPEQGTTFKIYLPRIEGEADTIKSRVESEILPSGTETILLAEDDNAVRELAVSTLEHLGYTVISAQNGGEAYLLARRMPKAPDLIVTDVVMPSMSGADLVDLLKKELWPNIKTLYISGYAENVITYHGILKEGISYLQKPFRPVVLAQKVREVLDT
jgi:PAS domain S-box-containing protein